MCKTEEKFKISFAELHHFVQNLTYTFLYWNKIPVRGGFMLTEECTIKTWKQWIFCLALAGFVTFLFYNPNNMHLNLYWFSSVLALSLFALELVSMVIAILTLLMFYLISGISTPDIVFSGWLAPVPWIILSGMLIGILMEKTNLARRIALIILSKVAKTPLKLLIAFFLSGVIISALIPDIITVLILFMTIATSICQSLNLEKGSKEASTIIMGAFFGGAISSAMYLPNNTGIIGLLMVKEMGVQFSWIGFFLENCLYSIVHITVCIILLYLFGNKALYPHIQKCVTEAKTELEKLGPMNATEKKALVLSVLALAGFVLEPVHHLPGYYLFAFIVFLGFTPIFGVFECSDVEKVNYSILFFIVGCMAIGFVAGTLGIPAWLSSKIVPVLQSIESSCIANLFAYFVGVIANFLLTPVAAATSLSVPMAQIAVDLGMTIKPILYSFLYGLDQFVLPYELAPALIMFSTGYVRLKYLIIIMSIRLILAPIGIILSTYLLWPSIL